ncbi:MAG TPA: hypothetical protein VKE29_03010 [Candidatus Udaeobacter sp.]|nr:hypothetical protein [Candidatus Udaeobacter sp.]
MKKITAASTVAVAFAFTGCGFFGSGEAVKQDPGRTVYRASEAAPDVPETTTVQEQVAGEKRSKLF